MRSSDPLIAAWPLLRPRLPRLALAIVLGSLSLGSALALAAVSAWLITRAWQLPPVLDLSIAVVAVRALGISRGVLHYCERLASHDTALRAAGTARTHIYHRLANGPADIATRLHSGDLVARVGADVDALADVLVRAVLPVAVASVLGVAASIVIAVISPAAAAVLVACLPVAGLVAPRLAARAASAQEALAARHHAERDIAAMTALEHAAELKVAGRLAELIAESERRQHDWGLALDRAATPAAFAAAVPTAALGVSVLGAAVIGVGLSSAVAPTTLAILMLLPLSAFEATTALPAAAIQLTRSRIAAGRLLGIAPEVPKPRPAREAVPPNAEGVLRAVNVEAGFGGTVRTPAVTMDLKPGDRLAVTGPSGCGKTTLLMTLAGLQPPQGGRVSYGEVPLAELSESHLRSAICFFAEDGHLFATTVRDNLLVVRGNCDDAELDAALERVGLGPWLAALPDGLSTVLVGGAQAVSAGQRRRLLLARALLSSASMVLLDEPTEHLDSADSADILRELLAPDGMFPPGKTVVVATHHLSDDIRCERLSVDRGGYPGCRSTTPA